jgi:hypothetical protein
MVIECTSDLEQRGVDKYVKKTDHGNGQIYILEAGHEYVRIDRERTRQNLSLMSSPFER